LRRKNIYSLIIFENLKPGRISDCLKEFLNFYLKVNDFCFLSYNEKNLKDSEIYNFTENEFLKINVNEVFLLLAKKYIRKINEFIRNLLQTLRK